jgi:hypothetical protein
MTDDDAAYHDAICAWNELSAERYEFDRSEYAT